MLHYDRQFFRWVAIGLVAAVIADALLYPFQLLITSQTDAGAIPPALGLGLMCLLAVILTVIAVFAAGERGVSSFLLACVATVIAFLIEQSTHLAALSLGLSVAMFGDRRHSVRTPLRTVSAKTEAPSRVAPVASRSASRRRRRHRR
jgi:hypothetical protein